VVADQSPVCGEQRKGNHNKRSSKLKKRERGRNNQMKQSAMLSYDNLQVALDDLTTDLDGYLKLITKTDGEVDVLLSTLEKDDSGMDDAFDAILDVVLLPKYRPLTRLRAGAEKIKQEREAARIKATRERERAGLLQLVPIAKSTGRHCLNCETSVARHMRLCWQHSAPLVPPSCLPCPIAKSTGRPCKDCRRSLDRKGTRCYRHRESPQEA